MRLLAHSCRVVLCAQSIGAQPQDGKTCICPVGTYFQPLDSTCHDCPTGADCSVAGLSVSQVGAQTGWWRGSNTSLTFYACLVVSQCLGGINSQCASYRTGPLCANCEPG